MQQTVAILNSRLRNRLCFAYFRVAAVFIFVVAKFRHAGEKSIASSKWLVYSSAWFEKLHSKDIISPWRYVYLHFIRDMGHVGVWKLVV